MAPVWFSSRQAKISVRPAQSSDLAKMRRVIEESQHAHLQLDWWTFEDWVGNPGLLVAEQDKHIVGLGMGVRDTSPVAWLRALVAENGLGVDALLDAVLPPMLIALGAQGVRALDCMAWPEWLADKLPIHGFSTLAQVVTLRQDETTIPTDLSSNALVREATSADLDAVIEIDHASFEDDWWYGQTTFLRAMRGASRFAIAERDGLPIGYGFAHTSGSHAHVTRLAVHPAHQKQGVGALLLADLIGHSRAQGADVVTLNTQTYNKDSLRLYRRFGFTETDTVVTAFSHKVDRHPTMEATN